MNIHHASRGKCCICVRTQARQMKSNKPSDPAEGGIHQPKSPNSKAEQPPYRGAWLRYRDPSECEPTDLILSAGFSLHDNAELAESTIGNP